ncbi:MAG: hypothetical protein IJ855_04415 [Bacteroidales bacterium]|nr:hypothetical protein [Bacteroidales bacterium]
MSRMRCHQSIGIPYGFGYSSIYDQSTGLGGHRHSVYEDYDHTDEKMYVDDQNCRNCRFFRAGSCVNPSHVGSANYLDGDTGWCVDWKKKGRRR